jgi:dolichyl-phosphate beta-glucosyltransferase
MTTSPDDPMKREAPLTSLVFPTYNPGASIEKSFASIHEFLHQSRQRWEAVFVCDGCTDGTPERLQTLISSGRMPMRILTYVENRGKGYAVRQGMLAARGKWRIFTDVDLAYGFDDVRRVAGALTNGADVAIASRDHPESEVVFPPRLIGYLFRRHLQSQAFGALARWLLRIDHRDTQAGLKGMTAEAANRIMPHLRCDGFGFDCELLTACARFAIPVREVPVRVRYDDGASTTGWRTVRRMIGDLFRIRRDWRSSAPSATRSGENVRELPTSWTNSNIKAAA